MRTLKTLDELLSVQYATINNLYSYKGKTYKGSVLQVDKDIKKYLKAGWVAQIPFDIKPRSKRQQYFYYVTREGAKAIDRLEDYKQKFQKSLNNAEHESMKIDVAVSFIRNFPDYEFTFDYKRDFNKLRPDIFVKARNIHTLKEYTFFVEVERKKELSRIHREKVQKYRKFINNGLFSKNKLPDQTKVLLICVNHRFDVYLRPTQYEPEVTNLLDRQFEHFQELMKNEPNKHFRYIKFTDIQNMAEPIWSLPSGERTKILD